MEGESSHAFRRSQHDRMKEGKVAMKKGIAKAVLFLSPLLAFAASDPEAFRTWCIGAPRRIPDNQDVTERQCARPDKQSVSATESKILRLLGLNEKTKLEEQV